MRKLESEFKRDLVKSCQKLGAYACRHEDRYGLGRLDLSIKFPDYPHLLAEGKVVLHQSFGPTLRQYQEGKDYIEAGGIACLIGWSKADKKMYVAEWSKTAKKEESFYSDSGTHGEQLLEWLKNRQSTSTHQDTKRSILKANSSESIE